MAKVTMPSSARAWPRGRSGSGSSSSAISVALDEPLLEVITDKVNAEVPSPFEGMLRKILVDEGQTVPYNAEIAEIEEVSGPGPLPVDRARPTRRRRHPRRGRASGHAAQPAALRRGHRPRPRDSHHPAPPLPAPLPPRRRAPRPGNRRDLARPAQAVAIRTRG